MSESQINLIKPPRSPPMDIPRKERTVYNSFFPEPSRKNVITKLDIIRNNKKRFNLLKEELEILKKELQVFTELKKGEKIGKEGICENNKIEPNSLGACFLFSLKKPLDAITFIDVTTMETKA